MPPPLPPPLPPSLLEPWLPSARAPAQASSWAMLQQQQSPMQCMLLRTVSDLDIMNKFHTGKHAHIQSRSRGSACTWTASASAAPP